MRKPALLSLAASLGLLALLPLHGCKKDEPRASPRTTRAVREHAEEQALQPLLHDPAQLRQRIDGATIVVPRTGGTSVLLKGGRAQDPATPPAWNIEVRSVSGVVPQAGSLDAFVDLVVHRPLHPPECYLGLLHLDSLETVHTSSIEIGPGARVLSVEPEKRQEGTYNLKIDYLGKAPQGDLLAHPTDRKRRLVTVVNHIFKVD